MGFSKETNSTTRRVVVMKKRILDGTARAYGTYSTVRMVRMFQWLHKARLASGRGLGFAVLLAVSVMAALPAHANQDVVEFGNTIEVPKDSSIHDAVCFFCSLNAEGTVNGDIVVFFGNVKIHTPDGRANHDVVNFFGNVEAGDDTSIGGSLVNFFGSVHLGERASIGKDTVVMFGSLHAPSSVSFGGDRVVQPGWIFWGPLLTIVIGLWLLIRELRVRRYRRILRGY